MALLLGAFAVVGVAYDKAGGIDYHSLIFSVLLFIR